jgi:hypothetical protein
MSTLRVTNLKGGSAGSAPNLPDGAVITGVATVGVISATTIYGSGANLTGIDATALKDGGGSVKIQANSDGAVVTGVLTAPTVSGTTGSFTGNVSVGGTLTYEDVTNVDSVGLITARNGIKVTGGDVQVGSAVTVDTSGINVTGIVTATSFVGDGSGLTDVPGGNVISGIASGSIATDKCMSLTQDGKILEMTTSVVPANFGQSGGTWGPYGGGVTKMNVRYVPGVDRFVMFMRDVSANFRYNVININTGVPPQMISNGNTAFSGEDPGGNREWHIRTANIGSNMIVVLYSNTNSSSVGRCVVGTVDGTSNSGAGDITWGTPVTYSGSSTASYADICYDPNQSKVVITYQKDSARGKGIVGNVSGSGSSATVTFGTEVDINSAGNSRNTACVYDESASRVVIAWENSADSQKLYARTATVSGTTITMSGSLTEISAGSSGQDCYTTMTYAGSPYNKSVVAYKGNSGWLCRALSVSGDTITGYTQQSIYPYTSWSYGNVVWDSSVSRLVFFYQRSQHSNAAGGRTAQLAENGTISSFGGEHEFDTGGTYLNWGDVNFKGKGVTGYDDDSGSHTEAATVLVGNVVGNIANAGQYIGFADKAYTDGQTVTVITIGNTKTGFVGLTTGSTYFAHADGTINTTWDSANFASFANNTPIAGRALNSTSLQIFQPV